MKLYSVKFGNGHNGSRTNIGGAFVVAPDRADARKKVAKKMMIPLNYVSCAHEEKCIF